VIPTHLRVPYNRRVGGTSSLIALVALVAGIGCADTHNYSKGAKTAYSGNGIKVKITPTVHPVDTSTTPPSTTVGIDEVDIEGETGFTPGDSRITVWVDEDNDGHFDGQNEDCCPANGVLDEGEDLDGDGRLDNGEDFIIKTTGASPPGTPLPGTAGSTSTVPGNVTVDIPGGGKKVTIRVKIDVRVTESGGGPTAEVDAEGHITVSGT